MSSLWTPGDDPTADQTATAAEPTEADVERMRQEMLQHLLSTPVEIVVRDQAASFFQLAALHLSQPSPDLTEAALAIDAFAVLLDGLNGRIPDEERLREALAELRIRYVELKGGTGDERVPGDPLGE